MSDTTILTNGDIDPNVRIPKHVLDGAKAADAIHNQAYPAEPQPASDAPQPDTSVAPVTPTAPEPAAPAAPAAPATPAAQVDDPNAETWHHRYLSMQGRFNAAQKQNGELIQINTDLANE